MKLYTRIYLSFLTIACFGSSAFSDENLWQDTITIRASMPENSTFKTLAVAKHTPHKKTHQQARKLLLNEKKMGALLQTSKAISLPLPDGSMVTVMIQQDNILPTDLAKKYSSIKTYRVLPNKLLISGRLDMTDNGFHGLLQMRSGTIVFIDPKMKKATHFKMAASGISKHYVSYNKHQQTQEYKDTYSCGASHTLKDLKPVIQNSRQFKAMANTAYKFKSQGSLLKYRIAIAATGEYVAKSGGTVSSALSAIATTLSRVNHIYEKDLGIHLTLVENNDLLIYTNAQSDPYDATMSNILIQQNQNNIDAIIGSENYDIGHLFTTTGGGLASIASVCQNSRKAMGVSGIANPHNDSFNVDYVAHEMGHQLGATHTFNGTEGLCAGATRTGMTAFEPGSGSSVMSYAGACGSDNLQSRSDAMFHIGSIEQIRRFTLSHSGRSCGIRSAQHNQAPVADAGIDYIIPAQTPFELKGNAIDPDGDFLVYGWEQMDAGFSSVESQDTSNNALFRAYMPTDKTQRTFPLLKSILKHNAIRGESLPTQERTLNFKFVVQDGFNATRSDLMQVNIVRTGSRFALEQPRSHYVLGRSHTIKWNTASTEKAPINCDNVDIFLSIDSGKTFSHTLLEQVPNTGEATILLSTSLPEVYQARFKLACSDSIFFAISYNNFKLTLNDIADAKEVGSENSLLDKPVYKKVQKIASGGGSINAFLVLILAFWLSTKRLIAHFTNVKTEKRSVLLLIS